ncbi:putative cystathionine beta-synthase [Diaporthe ampelina]|uniref:Putative cystathionine beta-synthase n=1 Tax=Diaporthe ampelina TaxID=1214573 RepID=A0A0G2G0R1_9PEZI|nr:putative cystathionine beta-synthase [Diaporthe ampelina]
MATGIMAPPSTNTTQANSGPYVSKWANRYRGAAVEDLQPPAALSLTPSDPISLALEAAFERDYTHLTIVDGQTRSLLGYVSIPALQAQLDGGKVAAGDPISAAMTRFQRRGRKYRVITMDTPLEELEAFFEGAETAGQKHEFAVITDDNRRFVLGVATRGDLEEFVKRRPA